MDNFALLQQKVKTALNQDLQANRIDIVKVMSALFLLSSAKNEQELLDLIDTFKNDYISLQVVLDELSKAEKEHSDTDLQLVLSEMIKTNPARAAELAKLAAEPGLTTQVLLQKFPEAEKYLK